MITPTMVARQIARMLREPMRLKLYTGVPSEFAMVEVQGGGYRSVVLTGNDWQIITSRETPYAEADVINFVFDGTARVRVSGAYIVNDSDGGVIWVQEFPEAFEVSRSGDTIPVRPRMVLSALADSSVL